MRSFQYCLFHHDECHDEVKLNIPSIVFWPSYQHKALVILTIKAQGTNLRLLLSATVGWPGIRFTTPWHSVELSVLRGKKDFVTLVL